METALSGRHAVFEKLKSGVLVGHPSLNHHFTTAEKRISFDWTRWGSGGGSGIACESLTVAVAAKRYSPRRKKAKLHDDTSFQATMLTTPPPLSRPSTRPLSALEPSSLES
jgi:hypothetical protein